MPLSGHSRSPVGPPPVVHAVELRTDRSRDTVVLDAHDPQLNDVDFTLCAPVRKVAAFRGQFHKPVFAYVEGCPRLLLCESRLEARVLLEMEFEGLIMSAATQPLRLHYSVGASTYRHTPDFAITGPDGVTCIVDVKPLAQQDDPDNVRAFTATAAWCLRMGLRYEVRAGLGEPAASTVRFLAGYRALSHGHEDVAPVVLRQAGQAEQGIEVADLARVAAGELDLPVPVIMTCVFALMWRAELEFDLTQELDYDTVVRCAHVHSEARS